MPVSKRKAAQARAAKRDRARAARVEARQRAATARVAAAELRASCKARRVELREARRANLVRLREERNAARVALRDQYRRALADARADAERARLALRDACGSDAAALRREVAQAKTRAAGAAVEYRAALDELRRGKPRKMNIAERRAHELNEAEHDFSEEWERALLRELYARRKVSSGPRRTLSEAFAEWMHDHSADAVTYRDRYYTEAAESAWDAEEAREYERQARNLDRATRAPGNAPDYLDEWGGF